MMITREKFLKIFEYLILAVLIGYLIREGYTYDGIGFREYLNSGIPDGALFERSKTLWDWMELFLIPALLTFGALYLNNINQANIKSREEERGQLEKEKLDQREEFETWVKFDNFREQALQEYLAVMQNLILEHELQEHSQTNSVHEIARARTLDILRRLDGERKRLVLDFLYQTGLINKSNPCVSLIAASFGVLPQLLNTSGIFRRQDADYFEDVERAAQLQRIYLKDADLRGAIFCRVALAGANLKGVDFTDANLENANLSGVNLSNGNLTRCRLIATEFKSAVLVNVNFQDAHLNRSNLREANLQGAIFQNADLKHAKIQYANLRKADLNNSKLNDARIDFADLSGSNITAEQLETVRSKVGTILPANLRQENQ